MSEQSPSAPIAPPISFEQFLAVDIRVGRVLSASLNPKARKPAYVLVIDFGPLGQRTTSAQVTANYRPEELVGRQVVAVCNFPPKNVAGVTSEVLVLAAVCPEQGTVLLSPDRPVSEGVRIL
ncbi:tRNA-binding protein [Vitiosangium sp. GDMCC 1.1324]|uniref:tRNA-binding protein n=1 Tax=Vitiosangium sp. (strain GDMCC 1.1324) TaxID=2138576 RepID=UPI000D343E63|nr:tRNA-binding protein [Vitiosangium sp. GDMCC 1.1324]PTL76607.1 tRNA-binding protein [Vitiosangium sp. GDMCC 1.1324]